MNDELKDLLLGTFEASLEAQLRAVRRLRQGEPDAKRGRPRKGRSQVDMAYDVLKKARAPLHIAELLGRIEQAAKDPNAALMPLFVEAVEQYVTLGEICGVLRGVFGEYQPDVWV